MNVTNECDEPPPRIVLGPIMIDPQRFELSVDGKGRRISRARLMVLYELAAAGGRVVQHWRLRDVIDENNVHERGGKAASNDLMTVHVFHIRKAIAPYGAMIENCWGTGYRLVASPPVRAAV